MYIGYHSLEDLPIKKGDKVRIPKGTEIRSMGAKGLHKSGRAQTITAHRVCTGATNRPFTGDPEHISNPKVIWPGSGGYWSEADINDVELVVSHSRPTECGYTTKLCSPKC